MGQKSPGVEVTQVENRRPERLVPRDLRAQPVMHSPWFQLLRFEDPLHRLGRDGVDDTVTARGARQLRTRP